MGRGATHGTLRASPALGDALNPGYRYLEVRCLGCVSAYCALCKRGKGGKRRLLGLLMMLCATSGRALARSGRFCGSQRLPCGMRLRRSTSQPFGGWDDQRRSAAPVAVDDFAREAADRFIPTVRPANRGREQRPGRLDAIEPPPDLGDPAKSPLRPWLNSPCRTFVRQAVLAAATR